MRILLQRVKTASVKLDDVIVASIEKGFLLLVGIAENDTIADTQWLAQKVANLRVFSDENGLMNLDLKTVNGAVLSISQFTLHASYKKGNRPSFIQAAKPEKAMELYEDFNKELEILLGKKISRGVFGADMQVQLLNDGPVTLMLDSVLRE